MRTWDGYIYRRETEAMCRCWEVARAAFRTYTEAKECRNGSLGCVSCPWYSKGDGDERQG